MSQSSPLSSSWPNRIARALAGRTPGQIAVAAFKTARKHLAALHPAARAAARAEQAFDRQWGTDTSREVMMSALDFPDDIRRSSHHYQASGGHVLDQTIACAGIDPADYSFIDYGCGKGRIVLLAAAKTFRRAIGVEYSPILTEIARRNSAIFLTRGGARQTPEFWQGNAADYVPPAGNLFCYLYNSFEADILSGCLEQLEAAKRADPAADIVLAYVNPQYGDVVAARTAWREQAGADDLRVFVCIAA
ncbi:hypothetical protein [Sphingomonas sp.]|uniref:hypothetical protein n=1 Tax=Sphingomonas sp. TaxID=28214 RepID=UPI001DD63093|nr:hypothetical protein [Sphingomonas sp.]MBX9796664.1 class I SAM-dependent methyltransferase [Sphingomonas sp.]